MPDRQKNAGGDQNRSHITVKKRFLSEKDTHRKFQPYWVSRARGKPHSQVPATPL